MSTAGQAIHHANLDILPGLLGVLVQGFGYTDA
jgi:hypothetical protein